MSSDRGVLAIGLPPFFGTRHEKEVCLSCNKQTISKKFNKSQLLNLGHASSIGKRELGTAVG